MVRALSNINPEDIDRPTTSAGPVEYEQNFLYHESSLSPEGKKLIILFKIYPGFNSSSFALSYSLKSMIFH